MPIKNQKNVGALPDQDHLAQGTSKRPLRKNKSVQCVMSANVCKEALFAVFAASATTKNRMGPLQFSENHDTHVLFSTPAIKPSLFGRMVGTTEAALTIGSSRSKTAFGDSQTVYEDTNKVIHVMLNKAEDTRQEIIEPNVSSDENPDAASGAESESAASEAHKKIRAKPGDASAFIFDISGQKLNSTNSIPLKQFADNVKKLPATVLICVDDNSDLDAITGILQADDVIYVRNCLPDDDALMALVMSAKPAGSMWLTTPENIMVSLLREGNEVRWRHEDFIHDNVDSRHLMRLYYFEGQTVEELGILYGVDKSTISRRLEKLPKLRKRVKK